MTLDFPAQHWPELQRILRKWTTGFDVLAYGSRVTGQSHAASDLDLALRNSADPQKKFSSLVELKEDLRESNLPMQVDVMDWARIPKSFHASIEAAHVVLHL